MEYPMDQSGVDACNISPYRYVRMFATVMTLV